MFVRMILFFLVFSIVPVRIPKVEAQSQASSDFAVRPWECAPQDDDVYYRTLYGGLKTKKSKAQAEQLKSAGILCFQRVACDGGTGLKTCLLLRLGGKRIRGSGPFKDPSTGQPINPAYITLKPDSESSHWAPLAARVDSKKREVPTGKFVLSGRVGCDEASAALPCNIRAIAFGIQDATFDLGTGPAIERYPTGSGWNNGSKATRIRGDGGGAVSTGDQNPDSSTPTAP